jgi:hypothetical protein
MMKTPPLLDLRPPLAGRRAVGVRERLPWRMALAVILLLSLALWVTIGFVIVDVFRAAM